MIDRLNTLFFKVKEMNQVPSKDEQPLCRCRALYLGTSVFDTSSKKLNESNLNLSQLQDTISKRYPIDGSNFAKGIETWLSVFPSGLQMEHSSSKDVSEISGLFYYPIKSLVYCGALRLVNVSKTNVKGVRFVPLDSELAQIDENIKNPPLFVIFLKGIDSTSKKEIIECHVFVVGLKKSSMKLIEACQKAFNMSKISVNQFYKKYGNVPVVYCLKEQFANKNDKRVVVKIFDQNGYFYGTESTPLDCWQLFESETPIIYEAVVSNKKQANKHSNEAFQNNDQDFSNPNRLEDEKEFKENQPVPLDIDPYEKTDNLVRVEKRVDPATGQTIFIRWITDNDDRKQNDNLDYNDIPELTNKDGTVRKSDKTTPIIIREDARTPSPIIVEKYITKKSPQIIIKEIHVNEPAPPPYKVVQNVDGNYSYPSQQNQMPTNRRNSNIPPSNGYQQQTPDALGYNSQNGNKIIYSNTTTGPNNRPYSNNPYNNSKNIPQLEYKLNNNNYSNIYATEKFANNRMPINYGNNKNQIYANPLDVRYRNNVYNIQPTISSELKRYTRYSHPHSYGSPLAARDRRLGYASNQRTVTHKTIFDQVENSHYSKNVIFSDAINTEGNYDAILRRKDSNDSRKHSINSYKLYSKQAPDTINNYIRN